MLKTRTTPLNTIALIGVAVILVAALTMVAYPKITSPAAAPQISPATPLVENSVQAPASASPATARSLYVSEQSLRRRLDDAYEKHQTARVKTLLRILNGRYERRSGLPW